MVPAERRYHERKLEIIRKQLEKRQSSTTGQGDDMAAGTDEQGES